MRAGDDPWDVIAVVEGPGKINERTRDQVLDGTRTIATINGTRPVDCTVVRVIGLHAGPVAVEPQRQRGARRSLARLGRRAGDDLHGLQTADRTAHLPARGGAVIIKSRAPVPAAVAVAVGAPAGRGEWWRWHGGAGRASRRNSRATA